MIKVCHMTSAHLSTDVRIFHKQCTSLAKVYDVYLIAQGNKNYELNGVKITGIPKEVKKGFFKKMKHRIQRLHKVYKRALEIDADIYQIHDPELLLVALKFKRKGKKVIFDSHENHPTQIENKTYLSRHLRKIVSRIYKIYETKVCKRIDAVIFPCTIKGENIFEGRAKKVVFISNAVKLNELYVKYNPDFTKKSRSVCYIGGLSYERGISHLIEASYKANATLILGGHFSTLNYDEKLKIKEEYKCVDYRGTVDRDDIADILNKSFIGACNILNIGQYNTFDNLATKVYEYMSMGLPVIISDYAYARQINEKYNCFILVAPDNTEKITKAINFLFGNPEIAKEMGQNGRRAVLEEFNWDVEEKKLLGLYESMCN